MTKRFFKKSEYIETISSKEIDDFLRKEKIIGKVIKDRVEDFYNYLSRKQGKEEIEEEKEIDYTRFNCKTQEDINEIEKLKSIESSYLSDVERQFMGERLLKTAVALAYQFEKGFINGESNVENPNNYLQNLFAYHVEEEGKGASFGEALEMDLEFMKYLSLLNKKKAFQSDNNSELKQVDGGKITKYTIMDSFRDVMNTDLVQIVMPNFSKKLVEKDVYVRKKYNRIGKSQNLIILVDDSGSMDEYNKKAMLKAILTLKLREANEYTNIYIGTFTTQVFGFVKAEKGMTFEQLREIYLNKGGTDVNQCVKSTIQMIKDRKLPKYNNNGFYELSDSHFEIMVANDGQDDVDVSFHPQIKLHTICLMQNNSNLKNICHRSGGTYHYLKPL